ncbi:MAG: Rab family GTPase [Candidatus Odinarchaeota archaeon]
MEKIKYKFKIPIIGDGAVGKTSLIEKFTKGTFQEEYISTLGAQFTQYEENVDGIDFKLIFWDIAGQPAFERMRQKFYLGSNGAIIVFSHSPDEKKTFESVDKWLSEVREHCGKIPVVLFGNKIDLINEEVLAIDKSLETCDSNIERFVKEHGIVGYFKTSALTGQKVNKAFHTLTKKIKALEDFLRNL